MKLKDNYVCVCMYLHVCTCAQVTCMHIYIHVEPEGAFLHLIPLKQGLLLNLELTR